MVQHLTISNPSTSPWCPLNPLDFGASHLETHDVRSKDTLHPQSLPAAIDAHFDQTLVFDLDGTPRYEPHPYKDALNVTETRQLYAQHLIRIDKESLGERQMMVG